MSQDIVDSFSTPSSGSRAQIDDSRVQLSVASVEFKDDHPVRVDAGQAANEEDRDQELVNQVKLSSMS
jgi:hypothetical protein